MVNDEPVRRRIAAVQLGLLAALLIMMVGPETLDLSRSFATQLALLATGVATALAVERGSRSGSAVSRSRC